MYIIAARHNVLYSTLKANTHKVKHILIIIRTSVSTYTKFPSQNNLTCLKKRLQNNGVFLSSKSSPIILLCLFGSRSNWVANT